MTNILIITADDMDSRTPEAFGGPPGVTPSIDKLAAEGMVFERSHVPIAVCQPSRSALMTGMLPHHNGAEGFGPIRDGITVLTDLLHGAGYLAGILGKVDHLQPIERFGWDFVVPMNELGLGRSPAAYGAAADKFFSTAREQGQPWFLMANAHDPHRPFHASNSEQEKWSPEERDTYPAPSRVWAADDVMVPGFLPDLPAVRKEYAQYLSSARRCDDVVQAVLASLDRHEYGDSTLVVFLSDNGMAFPFAKANCYLRSTHTPLVVRWPGVTEPGSTESEAFVSTLDLFPTFCEAIGVTAPDGLDGRSLVPNIKHCAGSSRSADRVFTVFHETSAKTRYEMRCVQDGKWGYIWNAWSDGTTAYHAENMEGLTWQAIQAEASVDGRLARRAAFYVERTPEELYNLVEDPDCLQNVAAENPGVLRDHQSSLALWMEGTQDPLAALYHSAVLDRTIALPRAAASVSASQANTDEA